MSRNWHEEIRDEVAVEVLTYFLPMFNKDAINLGDPYLKDVGRLQLEDLNWIVEICVLVRAW